MINVTFSLLFTSLQKPTTDKKTCPQNWIDSETDIPLLRGLKDKTNRFNMSGTEGILFVNMFAT